MQILHAARPIDDWLASTELSAPQRQRLQTARRMREFAISHLALPSNASYTRYANLQREYVVWNVVAAPVDSLDLHRWCFPIAGCVGYRGYFSPEDAREEAARLAAQGWEVGTYGVPAYSTLGWLNWLGGDPLLNTFLDWPEGDFAGLRPGPFLAVFEAQEHLVGRGRRMAVDQARDDAILCGRGCLRIEPYGVGHRASSWPGRLAWAVSTVSGFEIHQISCKMKVIFRRGWSV